MIKDMYLNVYWIFYMVVKGPGLFVRRCMTWVGWRRWKIRQRCSWFPPLQVAAPRAAASYWTVSPLIFGRTFRTPLTSLAPHWGHFECIVTTPDWRESRRGYWISVELKIKGILISWRRFLSSCSSLVWCSSCVSLAKISDWNWFRTNPKFSVSFRNLYSKQTVSFRSNPKKFFNLIQSEAHSKSTRTCNPMNPVNQN